MIDDEFREVARDIVLGYTKLLKLTPKHSENRKKLIESSLIFSSFVAKCCSDDEKERIGV